MRNSKDIIRLYIKVKQVEYIIRSIKEFDNKFYD
jgi:hypothetical protein